MIIFLWSFATLYIVWTPERTFATTVDYHIARGHITLFLAILIAWMHLWFCRHTSQQTMVSHSFIHFSVQKAKPSFTLKKQQNWLTVFYIFQGQRTGQSLDRDIWYIRGWQCFWKWIAPGTKSSFIFSQITSAIILSIFSIWGNKLTKGSR